MRSDKIRNKQLKSWIHKIQYNIKAPYILAELCTMVRMYNFIVHTHTTLYTIVYTVCNCSNVTIGRA